MNPRSEEARLMACLGYVPPVAIALLARTRWREIRLVRQHAEQALGLQSLWAIGSVMLAWLGTWSGSWLGFGWLALTGVAISAWLLAGVGIGIWASLEAHDGREARLRAWVVRQAGKRRGAGKPRTRQTRKT